MFYVVLRIVVYGLENELFSFSYSIKDKSKVDFRDHIRLPEEHVERGNPLGFSKPWVLPSMCLVGQRVGTIEEIQRTLAN